LPAGVGPTSGGVREGGVGWGREGGQQE